MEITVKCCPCCTPPRKVTLQSTGKYLCEKSGIEYEECDLVEKKNSNSLEEIRNQWKVKRFSESRSQERAHKEEKLKP